MHKQAALNTAKLFGTAALASVAVVVAIKFLTLEIFLSIFGLGFMLYFVYIAYSIEKSKLESIDKLNEISKKSVQ